MTDPLVFDDWIDSLVSEARLDPILPILVGEIAQVQQRFLAWNHADSPNEIN